MTEGHPDKLCDQVSDAVLDAFLAADPESRVACEAATTTGLVLVLGEITSKAPVDVRRVVRDTVSDIGYTAFRVWVRRRDLRRDGGPQRAVGRYQAGR